MINISSCPIEVNSEFGFATVLREVDVHLFGKDGLLEDISSVHQGDALAGVPASESDAVH